jgi:hypothetical protein
MKTTNPFPAIVRIERDQSRIQNQFSIFQSTSCSSFFNNRY